MCCSNFSSSELLELKRKGESNVRNKRLTTIAIALVVVATSIGTALLAQREQDKYTLSVPGGLAFSEFKGYESWQLIGVSYHDDMLVATVGNPAIIEAYNSGIPGNGKPFPDGAKMAKVHWNAKKFEGGPGQRTVPGIQLDVDFMVKNSKRFADSGGWGYGAFEYDAMSRAFRPANLNDKPPQANDAKCGYACHTIAQKRDYVFTQYAGR
jgi:hypothetical protein